MDRVKDILAGIAAGLGIGGLIGVGGPLLIAGIVVLGVVLLAFYSLIIAVPVYFLWNWLMPQLFDLPTLAYWQAWGITFLAALLVKGGGSTTSSSKS